MMYPVNHNTFGDGEVTNIDGDIIEVRFGDVIKKFKFPSSVGTFLKTESAELLAIAEDALARNKAELPKPTATPHVTIDHDYKAQPIIANTLPLVGERAQGIPVRSKSEMFEIVGYIASPGRISSFEAEVPKDGRDKTFEKLFPGQTYRPIEMGDTPSGLPNKMSSQFRINFLNIRNCPSSLEKNLGKGNGSCVARINKSKFVLDLVQNYGFKFGTWQDTKAIREIAEAAGFLEDFDRGYSR